MTRRGQCRCGTILLFQRTSRGFKTRCPDCGAVVRLRTEGAGKQAARQRKTPSAVLTAPSPQPLPEADTDFSVRSLPPPPPRDAPEPLDLSVLSDHESTAPRAAAELEVPPGPRPPRPILPWVVFGATAVVVMLGVGVAAMIWG